MAVTYDGVVATALDTSGTAQTLAITVPVAGVAAGEVVFVTAGWVDSSRTLSSVADTKGNTYRVDVSAGPRAGTSDWVGVAVGYIQTALVSGNTITLTWSGAGGVGPSIACRGDMFGGFSAIPVIDGSPVTNSQAASTAPTTGTLATTNQFDLLIAVCASGNAGTDVLTGDGAWSNMGGANSGQAHGTAHQGNFSQYRLVSVTGSYSATMADGTASNWYSAIVGYQQPGASPNVSLPIPFGARRINFLSPGARTRAEGLLADPNAQQARPNTDNLVTTWTRGGIDNGTLYGQVDEVAPGNDVDYITSVSS